MPKFGDWIAAQRRLKGFARQEDFAKYCGISAKVLGSIENSDNLDDRHPSTVISLATGLGITRAFLDQMVRTLREGLPALPEQKPNDFTGGELPSAAMMPPQRGIEIHGGISASGLTSQFDARSSEAPERIPMYLAEFPDAFGLRVRGTSMSPQFNDGDIVIFAPQPVTTLKGGWDCYVQLGAKAGNTSTFKKVWPIGNGELLLVPIGNGHAPMTVDVSDVIAVHRAIGKYTSLLSP